MVEKEQIIYKFGIIYLFVPGMINAYHWWGWH